MKYILLFLALMFVGCSGTEITIKCAPDDLPTFEPLDVDCSLAEIRGGRCVGYRDNNREGE